MRCLYHSIGDFWKAAEYVPGPQRMYIVKLTAGALWCVVWTLEGIQICDLDLRTYRYVELDFRKCPNRYCQCVQRWFLKL